MLRPMRTVLEKATSEQKKDAGELNKYFLDVQSHMVQILEDVDEGISECRDLAESYNTKVRVIRFPIKNNDGTYIS